MSPFEESPPAVPCSLLRAGAWKAPPFREYIIFDKLVYAHHPLPQGPVKVGRRRSFPPPKDPHPLAPSPTRTPTLRERGNPQRSLFQCLGRWRPLSRVGVSAGGRGGWGVRMGGRRHPLR